MKAPTGTNRPILKLRQPVPPTPISAKQGRRPAGSFLVKANTGWSNTLQQRLDSCEAKRKELGKVRLHTVRAEQLVDEDVILAIAAVWRGLWLTDLHFAFGTADLFRLSRVPSPADSWHGTVSVGAPNDFIIPLLFNPDDTQPVKRKIGARRSRAGHFVLAIAERDSNDSQIVKIQILDSSTGSRGLQLLRTTSQNIVRYSGWMGLSAEGPPLAVQPTFTEVVANVPQQGGAIECGFHVIFNAWAHMLGIPVLNNSRRRGNLPDKDFYKCGLRIVNLALSGSLDSETIQAFFNHFGYCEAQNPNDAVTPMQTVRMNDDVLANVIGDIQITEKAAAVISGPAQKKPDDDTKNDTKTDTKRDGQDDVEDGDDDDDELAP